MSPRKGRQFAGRSDAHATQLLEVVLVAVSRLEAARGHCSQFRRSFSCYTRGRVASTAPNQTTAPRHLLCAGERSRFRRGRCRRCRHGWLATQQVAPRAIKGTGAGAPPSLCTPGPPPLHRAPWATRDGGRQSGGSLRPETCSSAGRRGTSDATTGQKAGRGAQIGWAVGGTSDLLHGNGSVFSRCRRDRCPLFTTRTRALG